MTSRYSGTFRDSVTLYTHAVARAPGSIAAHYLLGVSLAAQPKQVGEAVAAFQAALRLNPDAAEVHENLGAVLLQVSGRAREGITYLENALKLRPKSQTIPRTLAAAWFDEGRMLAASGGAANDAIVAYERALQLNPDFSEAHFNLGNVPRTPGRLEDAIAHFETAVRLKPDFAEAYTNLGTALATQPGRLAEASHISKLRCRRIRTSNRRATISRVPGNCATMR